jgi:transglutaminase-like putative cysteine protease
MDRGLNVRRFALSDTKPDSITILEHLDYFKRIYMRDPYVRYVAVGLMPCLANNAVRDQISIIVNFVKDRLTYMRDPVGAELVHSPTRLLKQIMANGHAFGDCDDHSLLLNSMLGALGIQTRFVGVKTKQSVKYNHVICGVKVGADWVDIDPCSKESIQPDYNEKLVI